jgi:ATP-dependent 26S proteasome regulatory subunit
MNHAEITLASYIDALRPIIYIHHLDFKVIDYLISKVKEKAVILEFTHGLGDVHFYNKTSTRQCTLAEFLLDNRQQGFIKDTFIVLKDVHEELSDPKVISLLRTIAENTMYNEYFHCTVFIVSSKLHIPVELEHLVTLYEIPHPDVKKIVQIISEYCADQEIFIQAQIKDEIALSLKGLNQFQIIQILNLAYQEGGCIDLDDKKLILQEKKQLIKKSGMLEMVSTEETINNIGGLDHLKEWLIRKTKVFKNLDQAIKYGVDVPKGIMIIGMPGCGKSLSAKATATLFEIPLVRLDVGRLLGKYIGESEENMRRALLLAEATSPCVLWIDEIEKAFSGVGESGGGGDVTTRLFGQFLTWLQEKENTVFIVATANDISKIPPEFLRKGRFDELFLVDLPNDEERKDILDIHLKKRRRMNRNIDTVEIVKLTDGYNGADLEAIVKEAVEACFIADKMDIETEDLIAAVKEVRSISVTMKEKIDAIRKTTEKMDIKPASKQ